MTFLFDQLKAYKYDTVDNWLKTTVKRPIPVKWVDVNKGDRRRQEVRSRLTVADTKHRTRLTEADNAQTFSATPPYEHCVCLHLSLSPRNHEEMSHVLMFIDITRAHRVVRCVVKCGYSCLKKILAVRRKACVVCS